MTLDNLINQTGVGFGTSGVRALAIDITDKVAYIYTKTFLTYLKKQGYLFDKIALAGDRRPSTPRILNAVANACIACGYEVIFGGQIPTPAITYFGFKNNLPSIMVTGSHIPFDRNGIKFNKPDSELLKEDESVLKLEEVNEAPIAIDQIDLSINNEVLNIYLQRYKNFFPRDYLDNKKIGVYGHSSVAREILVDLLEYFGAKVTKLNFTEEFVPIDTEAMREEDRDLALQWSKKYGFDAIVSTDGDGDRPLIADETGEWLRADISGILVGKYLGAKSVVAPLSCNTALELSGYFQNVKRTKIGSPYVVKEMMNVPDSVIGYEANGGFLIGGGISKGGKTLEPLMTRDSLISIFSILGLSVETSKSVSQLRLELPKRFTFSDKVKDFPTEKSKQLISELSEHLKHNSSLQSSSLSFLTNKVVKVDETDGLRVTLENGNILHLRPSGNAPELRCYTEAASETMARELNIATLEKLKALVS